jgi:cell division protein FtsB
MITQGQFNRAMEQINESYSKLSKRVTALEAQVEKLETPPKKAPVKNTAKKVESA